MSKNINVQWELFKAKKSFMLKWSDYTIYAVGFAFVNVMIWTKELPIFDKISLTIWMATMFSFGYSFRSMRDRHKENRTAFDFTEEQFNKEVEIWKKVINSDDSIHIKNVVTKQVGVVDTWNKPCLVAWQVPDDMNPQDRMELMRCRDYYDLIRLGWVVD